MAKPPAFPMYAHDALVGGALMSCEEFGAYMRLLLFQWAHGSIPADQKSLRALLGLRKDISGLVLDKFKPCVDGKLRNERMEKEREKQAAFREKQKANGFKGGRPNAKPNESQNNPSLISGEHPQGQHPQDENVNADASFCNREGIGEGLRKDGFSDAWRDWRAYRAEKNEPLTSYTAKECILKCERWGAKKSVKIIRRAIEFSWKNLRDDDEVSFQNGAMKTGEIKETLEQKWMKTKEPGQTFNEWRTANKI
jgi:uncharacterized protein YdaU (DUF1376 family)